MNKFAFLSYTKKLSQEDNGNNFYNNYNFTDGRSDEQIFTSNFNYM